MKLGFVGVGNMGNPMCANLIGAGHDLTITDLSRDAAANLIEEGATWMDTAREVTSVSETTFLSLPKPADVEAVVTSDDGALAGAGSGTTIVDMSTNAPTMVRKLAEICNESGVNFLDAPVSGGVVGARRGTLAIMVGGDEAVYEACRSQLEAMGSNVFRVGDVGAGNVAKLVNNMLAFINMMGAAEALILGAKAGVDPMQLWKIVKASSGGSFVWNGGTRAVLRDRLAPHLHHRPGSEGHRARHRSRRGARRALDHGYRSGRPDPGLPTDRLRERGRSRHDQGARRGSRCDRPRHLARRRRVLIDPELRERPAAPDVKGDDGRSRLWLLRRRHRGP